MTEADDNLASILPAPGQAPRRKFVVEPMVFLYTLAAAPLGYLRTELLYSKVALHMGIDLDNLTTVNTSNHCDENSADLSYVLRERVQAEATQWHMYISVSGFLPYFVMNLVFGAYSDRIGRRITFIFPPIGCMVACLVDLTVIWFDLPVYFLFLEALECFFGGKSDDLRHFPINHI